MCEANGSQLVVFTECCEPSELEFGLRLGIYKRSGEKILRKTPVGKWVEVDFGKPVRRLNEVCQAIGIARVPIQRFCESYECDPHPNVQGNRAMAEDIRDWILNDPALSKSLGRFRDKTEVASQVAIPPI